jgi:phosphate:Na+ symporter
MVSVFGFKFQITPIAIMVIGVFFPFLFAGNIKLRNIAEAMIGFGILFIGLDFIKNAVPDINTNPELFAFLDSYTNYGYWSLLLFVGVGTVLTLLTQSSSAATAITLVMLFQGWISFPIAAAMILGENIGTTVTANIAALIGNVHAKRAARFHFFFNVIGVLWMLIIIYPFLNLMDWSIQFFTGTEISVMGGEIESRTNATLALSLFHTSFNVLNVIVMFAFVPYLVKFVERIQKDTGGTADEFHLKYINTGLMSSPGLSIDQAQKEVFQFVAVVEKMHYAVKGLLFKSAKKQRKFLKKIEKREEVTDRLEIEISEYLVKIGENSNLTSAMMNKVRFMQTMINDLERIGDIYYQISKSIERLLDDNQSFPEDALAEVGEMLDLVHDALLNMKKNVALASGEVKLKEAVEFEKRIDALRDSLRSKHFFRLENGDYAPQVGVIYLDVLNRLERIGDHILNVNESAAGRRLKAMRLDERENLV